MFFEAVLYIARNDIALRNLPGEFGAWNAVDHRFRRWVASGALARLFELTTPTRSSARFGGCSWT